MAHLENFLLQRHAADEVGYALGDGEIGVLVERLGGLGLGGGNRGGDVLGLCGDPDVLANASANAYRDPEARFA